MASPGRRKTPAGLRLPEMQEGPAPCGAALPARHGVRHFFCYVVSVVLISGGGGHLRLPAAWRHPVVRPDSDRQLLAHPPVSAEPAGAVSGCRYGPMSENQACSDRSGRAALCRAGNGAPLHT
ncbi:hypothetical protein HTZ85_26010 [Escherichia coli]|nr:hypothetical protein [Escherichia coli]